MYNAPRSWERIQQANAYLDAEDQIRLLASLRMPGDEAFDQRKVVTALVSDIVTDQLIRHPLMSNVHLTDCVTQIFSYLIRPEVYPRVVSPAPSVSELTMGYNDEGVEYVFQIKNMDMFFKEYFGETFSERSLRIREFLDTIRGYCDTVQIQRTNDLEDVCKKFCSVLYEITERYYFLSNVDLLIIYQWMVEQYKNQSSIFSDVPENGSSPFPVQVTERLIYVWA